jgi:5-methylcytosine-specific restriction endonuclease McrA
MPWSDPKVAKIKKREYYARNPEKWRAYKRFKMAESREKHKDDPLYRERARRWGRENYYRHREKRLAVVKAYRMAHEAEIQIKKKKYHAKNPHVRQRARRNWAIKNKATVQSVIARRRLRVRSTSDGTAETFYIFVRSKKRIPCYYCGRMISGKVAHIDHVIAIAKNGNHASENLCASCPDCNRSKSAKLPSETAFDNQPLLNL